MQPILSLTHKTQEVDNLVLILSGMPGLPAGIFTKAEKDFILGQKEELKKDLVILNRLNHWTYLFFIPPEKEMTLCMEDCRKAGEKTGKSLNERKVSKIVVFDSCGKTEEVLAFCEGMALGNYQFLKYKNKKENANTLKEIEVYMEAEEKSRVQETKFRIQSLNIMTDAVFRCRTLINEPNSYLTATVFAKEVADMAKSCGAKVEILNKKKMEALQMGGILGVNKGSHEPPAFTVMEWNPAGAKNKKPLVLVGKGVVYDTGGMNLKTGGFMMNMKDDMSGAAAVAATVYAVAKAKLPVHVVGLMPATDNRPGPEAMVSGDVIKMHNGAQVEVIDTDAEGRLLLADALSYAVKFDPGLVIDLATLTGSALRAIGSFAAVGMQSKAEKEMEELKKSGFAVYERIVEFPMWDDYAESLKSEIADFKNLGATEAGAITAGKFLEKFTGYPYIHLDIAGPAFLEKTDSYRGQGGTGFGVRLLFDYICKKYL